MIRLMAISRAKGNEELNINNLSKLSEQIQQKLKELQNPPECKKTRFLVITVQYIVFLGINSICVDRNCYYYFISLRPLIQYQSPSNDHFFFY